MALSGPFLVVRFVSRWAVVAMSNCYVLLPAMLFTGLSPLCAHSRPRGLVCRHRTRDQFVAFLQFTFENFGDLRDRVIRDAGADSNWLKSAVCMQLPQHGNIKTRCTYWHVTSSGCLARRMGATLL